MYDLISQQLEGEVWAEVAAVNRTLYNGDQIVTDFGNHYSISNFGRLRHNADRQITEPTGSVVTLPAGIVRPYEGKFSGNAIELYAVMYTADSEMYGIKISDISKTYFNEVPDGLIIREKQLDDDPQTTKPVFHTPVRKPVAPQLPPQRKPEEPKKPLNPLQRAILGKPAAPKPSSPRPKRVVVCIETQETFKNTTEAGKAYGVSESSVYDAIKIHNGYCKKADKHFKYQEVAD